MCKLSPVPFHNDTIFCVTIENQPYTAAKPIVMNLGLDWSGQAAKLSANKKRWGIVIIAIPSESGEQETTCIPVRKLPAFLASINPKKVKPELRERIELYQAECDDALWNYWMNGRAERAAEPVENPDKLTPAHRAELKSIVDAKLSTYPASVQGKARSEIWARFNRHFRIAEYAQLPAERMAEARDYLIELEVKALKALPSASSALRSAPSAVPCAEEDLAFIRACAREIMERERRMYFALRDTLPPLRGVTRPLALCLHKSMDADALMLDAALKQVENTARLVLEYARG